MDTRPIKVLVIDSDAPASSELCGKLADAKNVSFGVEVAGTISEGFELLGAARFDAVIIDLNVSGASGLASLKQLQVRGAETPIVVVSSVYQDSEALETVRAGAQDYLAKNRINPAALERILVHCIERQRARSRTAMQSSISRVLAEAETMPDATMQILRVLCESLEYGVGQAWSLDCGSGELVSAETWQGTPEADTGFVALNQTRRLERGKGLPGRAWAAGSALWISDVAQDSEYARAETLAGLRSALAFPITLGQEILGVIELFSAEVLEPDDELLRILTNIGNQIGQFLARKRDVSLRSPGSDRPAPS